MQSTKLIQNILEIIEKQQIEYTFTGSFVERLQCGLLVDHDKICKEIDILAKIAPIDLNNFPFFFTNLINKETNNTINLYQLTTDPFDVSRFERRYQRAFAEHSIYLTSPEDTILAKLRWAKAEGLKANRQEMPKIIRIYEEYFYNYNRFYIEKWVKELELEVLWQELQGNAEPML